MNDGVGQTVVKPFLQRKGNICTERMWRKRWRGVGPSGRGGDARLGKQMECQPRRKINEAAIGAN